MQSLTKEAFQDHLEKEHKTSHFADYIKEIVYGGNDGIVTTFAVVSGFSGAQLGAHTTQFSIITVLLFGLANLFADGAAMGLGNFLSIRAEKEVYKMAKNKEYHEVKHSTDFEKAETVYLLQSKGFTEDQATQMTDILSTNDDYWVNFMMTHELEMQNPEKENEFMNGLNTFLSFVFFGAIPLLPYFFTTNIDSSFYYSCGATFFALVLLGVLRGLVTKEPLYKPIIEVVLIGSTSAFISFFVGTFFRA